MAIYHAQNVELAADLDYGEGWIMFQWPDPVYGCDALILYLDGHCSRRMPIRSGTGPPAFVELARDRIRMRFGPVLARQLELEQEVEITFAISDDDFRELGRVIKYLNGEDVTTT